MPGYRSAMGGRHPRAMRPRDERAHPVVNDALDRGYLDTGREYIVPGFPDGAAANEARLSVNRAGRHLGVSVAAWVVHHGDGSAALHFTIWSKNTARAHVAATTGGDPARLRYNPFLKGEGRQVGDDGRPMGPALLR